jgi:hypothetical protein
MPDVSFSTASPSPLDGSANCLLLPYIGDAFSASAELIVTSWHEMHKAVDGLIFELFPG